MDDLGAFSARSVALAGDVLAQHGAHERPHFITTVAWVEGVEEFAASDHHVAGALKAALRFARERSGEDGVDGGREVGLVLARGWDGRVPGALQGFVEVAAEWSNACDQFVEDEPGGVDVGAVVEVFEAVSLLGAHVVEFALDDAEARVSAGDAADGDAEVNELDLSIIAQQDVLGVDVPVDDAEQAFMIVAQVMGAVQRHQHAASDPQGVLDREALTLVAEARHEKGEAATWDIFEHDDETPFVDVKSVNGQRVRVGEASEEASLGDEAARLWNLRGASISERRLEDLERVAD